MRYLLISVLLLLFTFNGPSSADLRAGVGVVDITPPPRTPLGGYGARLGKPMAGVHDRIHAKALVLDDGNTRVAIVTTDLIGSDLPMQRAIASANGLKQENVMLCASHTHSGPGALANNIFAATAMGKYDVTFYKWMRDQLIASVRQAIKSMEAAKLAIGFAKLEGASRNRRGDLVTDPQLTVIRVDRKSGKPLALLVNFAAHGTVLGADNMLVSGDWMGAMQRSLERSITGVVALYANGAEGDQSPVPTSGNDGFERCEALGKTVAQAAESLYREITPLSRVSIRTEGESISLPKTVKSALLGKEDSFIQIIAINDIALVAMPGEITAPLGLEIKRRVHESGFKETIAMGLANDHLGYVLTEEQFTKGGYEVQVSFYGEKFGPQLTEAIETLGRRMIERKKQ